ncbi:MAG TPA: hypothetical protein VNV44_07525 [Solirubrobacteraceae bacterium]|jgi:hypothetical protein|nr:hypothetical protein [Solirubrobacteraceae bacterium]
MTRARLLLSLAIVFAGAFAGQAHADVFGPIALVSGDPIQQADYAHDPAISADARFVAFDGSVGGVNGVWRRELATGDLVEVAGGDADLPSISADGRFISFTTNQGGQLPAFTDGRQHFEAKTGESPNVYVRDMNLGAQQPGAFRIVSARSGSNEPLRYEVAQEHAGQPNAGEEYGAVAAGRTAMSAGGTKVAFVTTTISNLSSYPQLEQEELEHGETPKPRTPALQVAVRDLETGVTQLVSVRRDPATGSPALNPETGDPEPVPTHTESGIYGAVDSEGVTPFFRAEVPAYSRTEKIGASISADGSTVAWMGQQLGEQVPFLSGEPPRANWTEPLWRRIADGELAPTRKVTGGSDPESPACQASGELRLPLSPVVGDPCQGPFETRLTDSINPGEAGVWIGDPEDDFVPKLSGDGYTVAFLARAPLFGGTGLEGPHSDLFLADMHPGLTRAQALRPLTQFGSSLATDAAITDVAVSPNASQQNHVGQVAFTTVRTVFTLGSPSYVSSRAAAPGLGELYDVDLGNDTLTRVTQGYEGGPAGHPFREERGGVEDPYVFFGPDDGSLAPSFDASGTTLAFSSTASNLVFGDNNTPPGGVRGAEDGADVFVTHRLTFAAAPPEQMISAPPANPAPEVPWKLGATAESLRDGHVRIYLELPGAGSLRAAATATVPLRPPPGHKAAHKAALRTVASKGVPGGVQPGLRTLELVLAPQYRALAKRKGGIAASALVTFAASGHQRLQSRLHIRFEIRSKGQR